MKIQYTKKMISKKVVMCVLGDLTVAFNDLLCIYESLPNNSSPAYFDYNDFPCSMLEQLKEKKIIKDLYYNLGYMQMSKGRRYKAFARKIEEIRDSVDDFEEEIVISEQTKSVKF